MQGDAIQISIGPKQRTNANIEKTKSSLKDSWLKHSKKVCLSYININSVRNKLEDLSEFVCAQVDFLAISEARKAPFQQHNLIFRVLGLHIGQERYNCEKRRVTLYVKGDIPSKMISIRDCPSDIQISPFKMNLKRQMWLVVPVYTPPSQCKSYFITELTKVLDKWRGKFESIGVLGDFNMEPTNQEMTTFMADTAFINIIKSDSFFKTSTGTFIDLT